MSRIQLFYDVAENMRHLADSIQALADEMVGGSQEPEPTAVAETQSACTSFFEAHKIVCPKVMHGSNDKNI